MGVDVHGHLSRFPALADRPRRRRPAHVRRNPERAHLRGQGLRLALRRSHQEPPPALVRHESLRQPRQSPKALPAREGGVAPGFNGSPVSSKRSVENHRVSLPFTYCSPCHPDRSEAPAERSGRTPPISPARECLRIFSSELDCNEVWKEESLALLGITIVRVPSPRSCLIAPAKRSSGCKMQ